MAAWNGLFAKCHRIVYLIYSVCVDLIKCWHLVELKMADFSSEISFLDWKFYKWSTRYSIWCSSEMMAHPQCKKSNEKEKNKQEWPDQNIRMNKTEKTKRWESLVFKCVPLAFNVNTIRAMSGTYWLDSPRLIIIIICMYEYVCICLFIKYIQYTVCLCARSFICVFQKSLSK